VRNFKKLTVALKQTSFLGAEFAVKKRITRREQFRAETKQVVASIIDPKRLLIITKILTLNATGNLILMIKRTKLTATKIRQT
jgi:hypothetical protein